MPRFHFNVYDGRTTIDQVGTDLDNLNEAKLEAIWLAGRMISENFEHICSCAEWRLEVADDQGLVMIRLDFNVIMFPVQPVSEKSRIDQS